MDPRHQRRIKLVQELYAWSYNKKTFLSETASLVIKNKEKIDQLIQDAAPKFPVEKIAKVDLAILRLAVYELVIEKKQPYKVVINEAIELAKEMAGERSPAFVNAVLGKIFQKITYEKT